MKFISSAFVLIAAVAISVSGQGAGKGGNSLKYDVVYHDPTEIFIWPVNNDDPEYDCSLTTSRSNVLTYGCADPNLKTPIAKDAVTVVKPETFLVRAAQLNPTFYDLPTTPRPPPFIQLKLRNQDLCATPQPNGMAVVFSKCDASPDNWPWILQKFNGANNEYATMDLYTIQLKNSQLCMSFDKSKRDYNIKNVKSRTRIDTGFVTFAECSARKTGRNVLVMEFVYVEEGVKASSAFRTAGNIKKTRKIRA